MKYLKVYEKSVLSKAHLFSPNEYKTVYHTLEVPKGILMADESQVKTYLTRMNKTTNLKSTPMINKEVITICMELGRLGYALHGDINLYHLDNYSHIHLVNKKMHTQITILYGQVFKVPNDQAPDITNIINRVMSGTLGWNFDWSPVKSANQ